MDLIKVAEEAFATGKKFTGKKARIAERRVITGE